MNISYPSPQDLIDGSRLFKRTFGLHYGTHFLHVEHESVQRLLDVVYILLLGWNLKEKEKIRETTVSKTIFCDLTSFFSLKLFCFHFSVYFEVNERSRADCTAQCLLRNNSKGLTQPFMTQLTSSCNERPIELRFLSLLLKIFFLEKKPCQIEFYRGF